MKHPFFINNGKAGNPANLLYNEILEKSAKKQLKIRPVTGYKLYSQTMKNEENFNSN